MYKIAICDDEISQTNQIEELLLKLFSFLDKTVEIDIFYTPESLINNVTKQGSVYQIIFLDIEMGKLDGVETARILREYDRDFILVFITSYTSYMLSSFEVKPFRYVLKPLQTEEFTKLIKDINQELDDRNAYLFYSSGRDKYQLRIKDVISIISQNGRKVQVSLIDNKVVEFYDKIKDINTVLPSSYFVRINSGTIINMNFIQFIAGDEIQLENGDIFFISRRSRKLFKQKYSLFIEGSVGL